MYLLGKNTDVNTEHHNSKGRCDLIVNFKNRRVIVEFKYTESEQDEHNLLKKTEEQIKNKAYGLEYPDKKEIMRIACVFNGSRNKRMISSYSEV